MRGVAEPERKGAAVLPLKALAEPERDGAALAEPE